MGRPPLDARLRELVGRRVVARLFVPVAPDIDDDEYDDAPPRPGSITGVLDVRFVEQLGYWKVSVDGHSVDPDSVVAAPPNPNEPTGSSRPAIIYDTVDGPVHQYADGTVRHHPVADDAALGDVVELEPRPSTGSATEPE